MRPRRAVVARRGAREFPTALETRVIVWAGLGLSALIPFVPLLPWLR